MVCVYYYHIYPLLCMVYIYILCTFCMYGICIFMHMYIYMYIHICTYVYSHTCIYVHVGVRIYIYIQVCVQAAGDDDHEVHLVPCSLLQNMVSLIGLFCKRDL